ncbi:GSCFA domain-containing protein [Arachidicoccus ginsenosidimutans]|uniref:GSCFA domain-containing protein n=1 Tax=Arachidicoccus sp. BS20 TaxID=1850526 RepID=UPI0007F0F41B|nr:GSCFA domain-containing protein [Arachidicoccus sp. BS20]ANI88102.1 GSCFA domain-containing protein [Arachidicoccus sp. BS20]
MQFQVPINIKPVENGISYKDKILLTGSCFTEHIGNHLQSVKFDVLQNPNGILFDSQSVCNSLISYMENKRYSENDLFYLNEAWHSWAHHSRFSAVTKEEALEKINASQANAHAYLRECDWLIITLGSSFSYMLAENQNFVANCHKAPAQTFEKHMNTIDETITALDGMLYRLFRFNPKAKVLFTVSPVRHIRDGVVENNRSKARLLEAVHHLVDKFDKLYYFPAYELVIDVLRDYRFYDIDLVHPNYAATQFVLEKFSETLMDSDTRELMGTIRKIVIAKNHKPFNPQSSQHKNFLETYYRQTLALQEQYPHIHFDKELKYFGS